MTEVAQVAAVDMEDISNEDKHEACGEDNEGADSAHECGASKEKPCGRSEEAKADKRTRRSRVSNKENEEGAVNGVAQDGETNTNEDQNASELALKKEVGDAPLAKQSVPW